MIISVIDNLFDKRNGATVGVIIGVSLGSVQFAVFYFEWRRKGRCASSINENS